ncbi:TetR/AcrR family transcriptional regulator [bacterium]|nr:MAG: TetR/AcrR family transcriptional regulator [bacterium]
MTAKTSQPEQDREMRQKILKSATRLFAAKGYAATSVREIVSEAGATAPVLYYYFQSKEGVYLEIMREALSQFESALTECAKKEGSAEEKLRYLAVRLHNLHCKNLDTVSLIHSVYHGPPQGAPEFDFDTFHKWLLATIASLVGEGISRGDFAGESPEAMTMALLGAVRFAMDAELCHPEDSPGEEGLSKVLDIIFLGMRPRNS